MTAHAHDVNTGLLQAALMWQLMMAGMMLPVTAPWLRAAFKLVAAGR